MDAPALRRALVSGLQPTIVSAVWEIGRRRLDVLAPEVLELFGRSLDWSVKERCAWALGRLRWPASCSALIQGLEDPEPRVREWSAWALGELGGPEPLKALTAASEKEREDPVLSAIWGGLKKYRGDSVRAPASVLERKLAPPKPPTKEIARIVEALSKLRDPAEHDEIVRLREQMAAQDPVYFPVYMEWLRRKPAIERALASRKWSYRDGRDRGR